MVKPGFQMASAALCALAAVLSCFGPASAAQQPAVLSFRNVPTLADGYPRQALRSLGDHGVTLHSSLVSDLSKSPIDSDGDHDWFSRYSFDLTMDLDTEKAMRWKRASIHFDLKQHLNVAGDGYDDVAQGYSNIDANSRTTLYEAWVMQTLWNDRVQVQAGKIDANTRFATVATASDFLNSSMGYSPTIMEFPTYPEPKGGVDVAVRLPASLGVTLGGFHTSSGKMALAELGKSWASGSEETAGKVEVGYWNLREPLFTADDKEVAGTSGVYSVFEQCLWESAGTGEGSIPRSLDAFVQFGTGNAHENSFTNHLGLGMVLRAPFLRRRSDSIGAAITRLQLSSYGDDHNSAEFVSDSYYKLAWSRSVFLVADGQYFVDPGAGAKRSPYLVLTPRLVIAF